MKLAFRQDSIAGQCRPIINRPSPQIDPQISIFSGPDAAQAFAETGRAVSGGVAVSIGFRLRSEVDNVDVKRVAVLLLLEVVADDLIDDGVRYGREEGSDGGGVGGEVGIEGRGERSGERGR